MKWSRAYAVADAPPIDRWPAFDYSCLDDGEEKEKVRNRETAVRMLVSNATYQEITHVTGLHKNQVRKLAMTCMALAPDGNVFGFRALLPYCRNERNVRRAPIGPKRQHQQGGMSGAFAALLARFDGLEDFLRKLIRGEKPRSTVVVERRIRAVDLHKTFLEEVKRLGVTRTEWPLNTEHKGRKTIERFFRDVLNEDFSGTVRQREESDAKAHLATGKGQQPLIAFAEPYDAVEIDAYRIDAILTAVFGTPEGTEVDVPLERLWILAAVERRVTAVLAYRVVYRSEVTSGDVAGLIRDAICKRWMPRQLVVNTLTYPKDGGFPSGVISEAEGALWTVTMLDGALANLAALIHQEVRRSTGFVINWGAPGHFERRPNVERMFKKIADELFHRLDSTTGSHPRAGRMTDASQVATKRKIRAREVEDVVDVVFAELNATPSAGNYYDSPLDALRYFVCGSSPRTMLRKMPHFSTGASRSLMRSKRCTIRGGRGSGRRPHVQYLNVNYSNSVLRQAAGLIGKTLTIYVDDDDLRQVTAFLPDGSELGILKADGFWGETKHDIATRKAIFSLKKKRVLLLTEHSNPIHAYLKFISTRSAQSKGAPPLSPSQATNVVRVARDAEIEPTIRDAGERSESHHPTQHNLTDNKETRRPLMPPPPAGLFKVKNG
ncbi:hypothetical protein [Paraburkholderia strydomiana]|uniref:hypothetical protein n=1 Tax=Paraburkholderia strydomiana TaxID=1245417 RepID=UPI0038BAACF1